MSETTDQQYEEVEVEVEVTDDEQVSEQEEEVKSPVKTPVKKPGKVNPSDDVKKMEQRSPESVAKVVGGSLSSTKNPFPSFGKWTEKTLSEIDIIFPVHNTKTESTNDLTRGNNPEKRFWKAPITFKYGSFSSDTIRFDNVHIPFHTGKQYGSGFIYLQLPGFAAGIFADAGKTRRPTRVNEASLAPESNRWWKIANKVGESFGAIDKNTKKFKAKSLETYFDGAQTGLTATVVLRFLSKCSTEDRAPLKPTTTSTVAVEVVRGFIHDLDVDVQMPIRLNKTKKAAMEPTATSGDIASDSVMKRLAELGL